MFKSKQMMKYGPIYFLYLFLFFQIINITVFLLNKSDKYNLNFDVYLNFIKYTTIALLLYLVLIFFNGWKYLSNKFNLLAFSFLSIIFALYFTMIYHTDRLAILSPTFLVMFLSFYIFSLKKIKYNYFLNLIMILTFINLIFVILQIFGYIPIAQENIRESIFDIGNRPTGIFYNAFAMGYAMSISSIIFFYELIKKNLKSLNILGYVLSMFSLLVSGTRTSLALTLVISIFIAFFKFNKFNNLNSKLTTLTTILISVSPLLLIAIGNLLKMTSLSGLNGRTELWKCVLINWEDFLPFGVGVQAAFPQGFCSDDVWFSKLRHPENMFLLTYVEAGIIGIITLLILFITSFYVSNKAIKNGNFLPWAISNTYLLSSLFYVPLFHYLPFLPNRTADRGIFNYFLMTLIWLIVLRWSLEDSQKTSKPR